jgi:hypothetical protein
MAERHDEVGPGGAEVRQVPPGGVDDVVGPDPAFEVAPVLLHDLPA